MFLSQNGYCFSSFFCSWSVVLSELEFDEESVDESDEEEDEDDPSLSADIYKYKILRHKNCS